ncbi:MAG: class I SAM-dependent methyltransferase [Nitrospirota bacterium]
MTAVIPIQSGERVSAGSIPDADLVETPCPLCNATDSSIIHVFSPFHVVSCSICGMIYLNPRLREQVTESLYRDDTYFSRDTETGYADYHFQEQSLRLTFRRFLRTLEKCGFTGGRLLEVGCGYGYFLDEAKDFFTSLSGIELSAQAAAAAEKRTGADIFAGTAAAMPPHFRDFDTVVLVNVIEHIYSPVHLLSALAERMKKTGTIILATPDIGSFWHRIMQDRWPSFKIPEHIAFYTGKTLKSLLERSGFRNTRPVPFPHAFPLGLVLSKLGLKNPGYAGRIPVWLPKTMTAVSGEAP